MEENPVDKTKELLILLHRVHQQIPMADGPKKEIAQCFKTLKGVYQALNRIHTEIVPLNVQCQVEEQGKNLSFWEDAPDGRVSRHVELLSRLTKESPTLQAFYRSGIDIEAIYRFSNQELSLSNEIGTYFSRIPYGAFQHFRNLLRSSPNRGVELATIVDEAEQIYAFLKAMSIFKITSQEITAQIYSFKKEQWFDKLPNQIDHIKSRRNRVRFLFDIEENSFQPLISGHWFNAFTFFVIKDHLRRNEIPSEVYARVEYTSPPDIFSAKGDFDVLASIGNTVIVAECKSGNLNDSSEIEKVISKNEGIKKVFENARSDYYNYSFIVVYNPYANNDQSLLDRLSASGFVVTTPEMLRGFIASITSQ